LGILAFKFPGFVEEDALTEGVQLTIPSKLVLLPSASLVCFNLLVSRPYL